MTAIQFATLSGMLAQALLAVLVGGTCVALHRMYRRRSLEFAAVAWVAYGASFLGRMLAYWADGGVFELLGWWLWAAGLLGLARYLWLALTAAHRHDNAARSHAAQLAAIGTAAAALVMPVAAGAAAWMQFLVGAAAPVGVLVATVLVLAVRLRAWLTQPYRTVRLTSVLATLAIVAVEALYVSVLLATAWRGGVYPSWLYLLFAVSSVAMMLTSLALLTLFGAGERRRAVHHESRFQALVEQISVGLALVGPDGAVRESSPLLRRLLSDVSVHAFEAALSTVTNGTPSFLQRCLADGSAEATLLVPASDGRPQPFDVRGATVTEANGERAILVFCSDASVRLRAEAEVLRANKMETVARIAGGIAHDVNNVLTAIRGHASLARVAIMSLPEHERTELDEELRGVEIGVDRAAGIGRQLVLLSRPGDEASEEVPLDNFIREQRGMLARLLGPAMQLDVSGLAAPDAVVSIARTHFSQVLLNLAANARDAMADGGVLRIATEPILIARDAAADGAGEAGAVKLVVHDSGAGMPPDVLANVFEPYFTTKGERGTGLGLATTYRIIRSAGGSIDVESSVGAGTRFTILLPVQRADEATVSSPLLPVAQG